MIYIIKQINDTKLLVLSNSKQYLLCFSDKFRIRYVKSKTWNSIEEIRDSIGIKWIRDIETNVIVHTVNDSNRYTNYRGDAKQDKQMTLSKTRTKSNRDGWRAKREMMIKWKLMENLDHRHLLGVRSYDISTKLIK